MPFSIYRGNVENANKLEVRTGPTLYKQRDENDFWEDRFHSRSPNSKADEQTSHTATVYINEDGGREETVIYTPPKGARSVRAARRAKNTVSQRHRIVVRPDNDNLYRGPPATRRLTGEFEAELPSGWQVGKRRITFTLSQCSPDRFVVTYRYYYQGQWWASHLVVEVRKRIQCHLYEMRSGQGAQAGDTIQTFRPIIKRVQGIYASLFGIDLVFDDDRIQPEHEPAFRQQATRQQLNNMVPAAADRGPRDLWIVVVNEIAGSAAGVGWGGVATVEEMFFRDSRQQLERVRRAVRAGREIGGGDAYWQRVYDWMRDEPNVATVDFLDRHARTVTLAHEIGHALGLVPADETAGGTVRGGWHDAAHPGHCSRGSCAMFHEAELGQLPIMQSLSDPIFDHYDAFKDFSAPDGCNLYLRAAPLDDIR